MLHVVYSQYFKFLSPGLAFLVLLGCAQVTAAPDESEDGTPSVQLLSAEDLEKLVAPIALYPDDLVAIVLPASTYPIQVVQAARFLDKRKSDPKIEPDKSWDTSILGLLNYPEVVEKMNADLEWTSELGDAVVNRQQDVMEAIQQFRNRAYDAGNLSSSDKLVVEQNKEIIVIQSASPDVIYVPSYNPATVVVQQSYPYPYYYSAPYPYYYRPAAVFWTGMFVGAAVSYGLSWNRYGGYYGRGHVTVNHNNINVNRNVNSNINASRNRNVNRGGSAWQSNRKPGNSVSRPSARPGTKPVSRPGNSRPSNRPGTRPGDHRGGSTGKPKVQPAKSGSRNLSGNLEGAQRNRSAKTTRSSSRYGSSSLGGYKRGQDSYRNSQRGRSSRSRSSFSGGGSRSFGGGRRGGGGRRR